MLDKDKDFDLAHLGEIALMQGMAAAGQRPGQRAEQPGLTSRAMLVQQCFSQIFLYSSYMTCSCTSNCSHQLAVPLQDCITQSTILLIFSFFMSHPKHTNCLKSQFLRSIMLFQYLQLQYLPSVGSSRFARLPCFELL